MLLSYTGKWTVAFFNSNNTLIEVYSPCAYFQHLQRCLSANSQVGGSSERHLMPIFSVHLSAKGHPMISRCNGGGWPLMLSSLSIFSFNLGLDLIKAFVYGCFGESNNSRTEPISTILPAYMTAARWHILATMPKS